MNVTGFECSKVNRGEFGEWGCIQLTCIALCRANLKMHFHRFEGNSCKLMSKPFLDTYHRFIEGLRLEGTSRSPSNLVLNAPRDSDFPHLSGQSVLVPDALPSTQLTLPWHGGTLSPLLPSLQQPLPLQ